MKHRLNLNLFCLALSFYFFPTSFAAVDTIPVVKMSSLKRDTIPGKDTAAFKRVEKEAYFIGGENAWRKFLTKNLDPDVPIRKDAPAGNYTVLIQFIVNKDGTLDIEPLTNFGYGMEEEVVRVIKKSPLWIPAEQDGKKVRAYRKQPITFSVPEKRRKRSKD
jgi:hypothetical protein